MSCYRTLALLAMLVSAALSADVLLGVPEGKEEQYKQSVFVAVGVFHIDLRLCRWITNYLEHAD